MKNTIQTALQTIAAVVTLACGYFAGAGVAANTDAREIENSKRACTGAVYLDCYRASGEHAECREHAREICQ